MAYSNMMRFVSQAEKEGITLAEVLARQLSPKDLDEMEADLAEELSSNYSNIEDFMNGVSVPSIDEALATYQNDQSVVLRLSDDEPQEC
jgi:Rod binding domain-containing protein